MFFSIVFVITHQLRAHNCLRDVCTSHYAGPQWIPVLLPRSALFFFSAVLLFSRFGFPAPVSFNVLHREQPRKVKKKKKTRERKKKKKGWSACASLHCLLHFHFFLCCCCERACRAFCVTLTNVKLHRGSSASRRRRVSVQCKWQTSSIIGETEVCEGTLFVVVVVVDI